MNSIPNDPAPQRNSEDVQYVVIDDCSEFTAQQAEMMYQLLERREQ